MLVGVFLLLAVYLGWIGHSGLSAVVGNSQGKRTVTVAECRGTVYDRKMRPLVNAEREYRAAILPEESMLGAVRPAMTNTAYAALLEKLSTGAPAVARLTGPAAIVPGMALFHVPVRYGERQLAEHLIGYLDGSSQHGVSGLEYAYDAWLSAGQGKATATFAVNGAGMYFSGEGVVTNNTLNNADSGIITTLDAQLQQIAETVCKEVLPKGAVVILKPDSGELLTSVSMPSFHPESLAESIERNDGALVNRALSLYDCGSIFKIVTAAAALENGVPVTRTYACQGALSVGDVRFHCHQRTLGHQRLTMQEAFAQSCNLYFIQLAQEIGPDAILQMAERFGLTEAISLANGVAAEACVLPTRAELQSPAALANLSFGQGKLLLTPLHVARMTASVAGDGTLPPVSLVTGTVDVTGKIAVEAQGEGERALSPKTAEILQVMMRSVVTQGTGKKATLADETAAGKTGTAETGQVNNGNPVVQSWFTGYFPAENPRYCITVLVEDADTQVKNAAEVFCEISNKLIETERGQTD